MLLFPSRCSNSAALELTTTLLAPLTSVWRPFLLTNLWVNLSVWGGRGALLLSPAGHHHCWPPNLPSFCFLTAVCIAPVFTFKFSLLDMEVLTALERFSFLYLLALLCACKWGDLGFKRLLAVFKLSAVRHPWATWPLYSFLSPPLHT